MPKRPSRPAATARWPLVGRWAELDLVTAALRDRASRGVLVSGPPGVGKSRFAEECLALAAAAGRTTVRAVASRTAAEVPLGALLHLLPAELRSGPVDPRALFGQVAGSFRAASAKALPPVLMVDDLHLLDATSVHLLGQLLDAAAVFLIGTLRTDAPVPDQVMTLTGSSGGRIVELDLGDLSEEALDSLLNQVLRGALAGGTVAELWAAGQGNPLYTRELVLGALAAGQLAADSGVWRLTGPLSSTPRLTELVAARVAELPPAARRALELLALVEPAGLAELEPLAGAEMVTSMERAGLIAVRSDRRRRQVRLAHPLYGEVLQRRLPVLTRRRLLLQHADRIEQLGSRRREDPLRIATWRLAATGTADPALLLRAATLARYGHDHAEVERLARAALAELPSGDSATAARLLLGEALYELGSFADADAVLEVAQAEAADERQLVQIATTRARILIDDLRADEALAANRAARARVTGSDARYELLAFEATLLTFAGQPIAALAVLEQLGPAVDLRTRARRAIPEALALAAVGRFETAVSVTREGFAAHMELGEQLAIAHPGTHLITQAYALAQAGRLAAATELASAGYQMARKDRSPIGQIWFSVHLGRCALQAGKPATARGWLAEASALCRRYGFRGPHRHALSPLAVAAAWLGDIDTARAAVAELDSPGEYGFHRAEQDVGRAWAAWLAGDVHDAREIARAAATSAAGQGYRASEAWLLHDLARLGDPAGARGRLAELGELCEGPLVRTYALHAAAKAAGDAVRLTEAGERFEDMGMALLAAEAMTAAANAFRGRGEAGPAASRRARADSLAAGCEGARTPALVAETAVQPLTRREREVAVLASQLLSSKDIAERLRLSVRTVDAHLQNAYGKLGVARRDQLSGVLTGLGISEASSSSPDSPEATGSSARTRPRRGFPGDGG